MENVSVKILCKVIQTGTHYGKKDDVVKVPKVIAEEWIRAKHAALVDASPAPKAK